MQESIIVYRNPMEKAFWEGGYAHPMTFFAVVMAITFFITFKALGKMTGKHWNQPNWFLWVSGVVGVVCGSIAFIYTMP